MDPILQARLSRLSGRHTRYEATLVHALTGETRLLCYTARKNKHGLRDYINTKAEALAAFCGAHRVGPARPDFLAYLAIGDWQIGFTGRTQREAILGGELKWFAEDRS